MALTTITDLADKVDAHATPTRRVTKRPGVVSGDETKSQIKYKFLTFWPIQLEELSTC